MKIVIMTILFFLMTAVALNNSEIPEHSCPSGHVFVADGNRGFCCPGDAQRNWACFKTGKVITYADGVPSNGLPGPIKHMETNYVDNQKDGPFVKWRYPGKQLEVEGNYQMGIKSGKWIFHGQDGKEKIEVVFSGTCPKSITLPNGSIKHAECNNVDDPTIDKFRLIGYTNSFGSLNVADHNALPVSHEKLSYVFAYDSSEKKNIIGLHVNEHVFYHGLKDDTFKFIDESTPGYEVFEKVGNMCHTRHFVQKGPGSYSYIYAWVECGKVTPIIEHLAGYTMKIKMTETFYEEPGNKPYRPKFAKDPLIFPRVLNDPGSEPEVEVKQILDTKIIKEDTWVKVALGEEDTYSSYLPCHKSKDGVLSTGDCGEKPSAAELQKKYKGPPIKSNFSPWIPLYRGNTLVIKPYTC